MKHLFSCIASACAIFAPHIASACTVNQVDSRTLVISATSSDCKLSAKEMAQHREELSKALASLSSTSTASSVTAASSKQSAEPQKIKLSSRSAQERLLIVHQL